MLSERRVRQFVECARRGVTIELRIPFGRIERGELKPDKANVEAITKMLS